jgi:hypothetical protein
MVEGNRGLSWRVVGLLAAACAAILAVSLYVALRPSAATPAAGPYPDLVLKGKLTRSIPWNKLPVSVKWDGTKAGDIPRDLQAAYRGQTLYKLIGLVDDKDPATFNVARARKGYGIKFIAGDGYSWTMKSKAIIGKKNWIVARLKNGKPLPDNEGPYRDVGSFIKHFYGRESVKLLLRIELVF